MLNTSCGFLYKIFSIYLLDKARKHIILIDVNKKEYYISIIIITLNEQRVIQRLLTELSNQTYQNFEVIVADSDSSDKTKNMTLEMKDKLQSLRFENANVTKGPAYGRNFGVKFAKYEDLLFLDADTKLMDNTFLERYIRYKEKYHADCGGMYPRIETKDPLILFGNLLMRLGIFITQFISPTAIGACLYSTKTVHTKINGFRENVHLCEDADYVRDAKRAGFKTKMLPMFFCFDSRRFERDGILRTNGKYLYANLIRLITRKSINKKDITYQYGNYKKTKKKL
jgi:glycosyltransferase involved in cell wall biosynthesis